MWVFMGKLSQESLENTVRGTPVLVPWLTRAPQILSLLEVPPTHSDVGSIKNWVTGWPEKLEL